MTTSQRNLYHGFSMHMQELVDVCAAMSPREESKHALFVSIMCLEITWGPASSLACSATKAGSRGWGQSGAPSLGCYQEKPVSLRKVSLQWKHMTFVSVDTVCFCISSSHVWTILDIKVHPCLFRMRNCTDTNISFAADISRSHCPRQLTWCNLRVRMGLQWESQGAVALIPATLCNKIQHEIY